MSAAVFLRTCHLLVASSKDLDMNKSAGRLIMRYWPGIVSIECSNQLSGAHVLLQYHHLVVVYRVITTAHCHALPWCTHPCDLTLSCWFLCNVM